MTEERTLIGTGTTNSSGVATIEYTGTGAGEIEVVAVSGDYESDTILVIDDYVPVATDFSFETLTPIVEVGDTISLKAVLLDQYSVGIEDAEITVTVGSSEYTSNTNSSGVASFSISDLSSSGKFTFEASYGSLTAECEVINALFYDDGITDTASWDMILVNKSVSNTGKTFTASTTDTLTRASMNPLDNSSAYDFEPNPFVWEFDVVALNGSPYCQVMQDSPRINKAHSLNSNYVGHTVRYVFDGESTIKEYIDDSTTPSYTITGAEYTLMLRIGFTFNSEGTSITVKNVRIYSSS